MIKHKLYYATKQTTLQPLFLLCCIFATRVVLVVFFCIMYVLYAG